ncbi:MAG: branched chain amino acid aminotransferase, partial [Acidobacteria bacterium]
MAVENYPQVWHNGKFIPWEQATVHVASHVVSYGSCLFEGIRCYETPTGPAIFRLKEHVDRLVNSCKIYRMELAYSAEGLAQALIELVRVNKIQSCYLRPVIFRGFGEVGVSPLKNPVEIYLLAWQWGRYLGADSLKEGVDVCVS